MLEATLLRLTEWAGASTSSLMINGVHVCFTLSEAWRANMPKISCIPDGEYICEIVNSLHFGRVYEIKNVPGRSHVLFHSGNTVADTEGCELFGSAVLLDGREMKTVESRKAMSVFMEKTAGQPFKLRVITAYRRA